MNEGGEFSRCSLAFVGHPQAVIEAALAAGRAAYNLIDMTRHTGEHPRVGAMVIDGIPR